MVNDQDLDAWLTSAGTGDQFVALSMSRPQTVLGWCAQDLDRLVQILGASYVWQARGLAARELGDATCGCI